MQAWPWRVALSVALWIAVWGVVGHARAQAADDTSAGVESYRELTLDNGLRVVIAVDRRVPQVALHVEYSVGDALDPPEERGLAQLIGTLLPALETRHLRATERPRLLRAANVRIDEPKVLVNLDATSVSLQVAPEALELALWLEADRMGFAADGVTESAVQRAIPDATSAVERSPADVDSLVMFHVGLGSRHPYGVLDRHARLAQTHAVSVANRLHRYYNPATAVLVLVGDVDTARAEEAVRRTFGPLPSAALKPAQPPLADPAPRSLSMVAPIQGHYSAVVWQTPAYFEPDDAGLDVVATILARRIKARNLCKWFDVRQHSSQLASVFVATCGAPTTSSEAWHAALEAELAALAEGRASPQEVEGAALYFARVVGQRSDDLLGRAQYIASSVRTGHGSRAVPRLLATYTAVDVAQVASIVRRRLLPPPTGTLEITPLASAPKEGGPSAGESVAQSAPKAAEDAGVWSKDTSDWLRPPPSGAMTRYEAPTGLTEALASGDHLRFLERHGVPVAYTEIQLPWPATAFNAAARSVLATLVKRSPTPGGTLEQSLGLLGATLWVDDSAGQLELDLNAPPSRLAASLELLAGVLASKQLPKDGFEAAKRDASTWAEATPVEWLWYWDALGLSAPSSRYRYLGRSERARLLSELKFADVDRLWHSVASQPRAIDLVGPFDAPTARGLAAVVARKSKAARTVPTRAPARGPFHAGVYVLDAGEGDLVEGCLLWPLPDWATPGHFPAHLLPYLFRTDTTDGFGARLAEHSTGIPYWQSNTLITPDGDFFRYSFRVSAAQLAPLLESVKAHLARLANGDFAAGDFNTALVDEREFQIRQALSGKTLLNLLGRAGYHDTDTNDALTVPLGVERVTRKEIAELAKTLAFGRATIGLVADAARLTPALSSLELKATSVTKTEWASARAGTP